MISVAIRPQRDVISPSEPTCKARGFDYHEAVQRVLPLFADLGAGWIGRGEDTIWV